MSTSSEDNTSSGGSWLWSKLSTTPITGAPNRTPPILPAANLDPLPTVTDTMPVHLKNIKVPHGTPSSISHPGKKIPDHAYFTRLSECAFATVYFVRNNRFWRQSASPPIPPSRLHSGTMLWTKGHTVYIILLCAHVAFLAKFPTFCKFGVPLYWIRIIFCAELAFSPTDIGIWEVSRVSLCTYNQYWIGPNWSNSTHMYFSKKT